MFSGDIEKLEEIVESVENKEGKAMMRAQLDELKNIMADELELEKNFLDTLTDEEKVQFFEEQALMEEYQKHNAEIDEKKKAKKEAKKNRSETL